MAQLGYAIVFISHDKEKSIKPQNSQEYQQIGSSMQSSALSVIENMSDIIAYARTKQQPDGTYKRVLTLRSDDNSIRCGCRFRYMPAEVDFSYEALTNALNIAIEKEAHETNDQFITNERQEVTQAPEYDYEALMAEFQDLVGDLIQRDSTKYAPRITQIVDKILGKGKKVSETTLEQAELIYLIISEIKAEIK